MKFAFTKTSSKSVFYFTGFFPLKYADKIQRRVGGKRISLSAQCRASGFYQTLGYPGIGVAFAAKTSSSFASITIALSFYQHNPQFYPHI